MNWTKRRQVANYPQNTLKKEKAPNLGHFFLESMGRRPLLIFSLKGTRPYPSPRFRRPCCWGEAGIATRCAAEPTAAGQRQSVPPPPPKCTGAPQPVPPTTGLGVKVNRSDGGHFRRAVWNPSERLALSPRCIGSRCAETRLMER